MGPGYSRRADMTKKIDVTGLPKHDLDAVEALVRLLKEKQELAASNPEAVSEEEFERLLDEFSEDLPVLPPDFSRADIYDDDQ
jgi:hypothetical protein